MQSEALKPCPFCGSSDVRLRHHQANQMSWVSCVGCGLEAPSETGVSDENAVSYWNRRAEAALSTDAEPDGWVCEDEFTLEPDLAWEWEDKGLSPKPFYFNSQQNADPVNTAPAVAVKALQWREGWGGSDDDIVEWVADTPWGRVFASVAGYRDASGEHYERHADVPDELRTELQSATEAHHKARIRSALSAQVQDVAETLETYCHRQIQWSRETFGPALRTKGIIDHIKKELHEIDADPHDLSEWVDVVILAMDGFWRHGGNPEDLFKALVAKQKKNMARTWPDWRTMSEDSAIEHDRSKDAASPASKHGDAE